jgi:hypothetical protein
MILHSGKIIAIIFSASNFDEFDLGLSSDQNTSSTFLWQGSKFKQNHDERE